MVEAAGRLGGVVVVRSSSRAEAEGVWAGAFSSYLSLRSDEVPAGVTGCWASVFNPGVLKRARAIGISPPDIGMAVLVQTRLRTSCGGVATLGQVEEVRIVGMAGHPAPLVAGWQSGHALVVAGNDSVEVPDGSPLSREVAVRVAHLARGVGSELGYAHIEWAADEDGEVYLLQAQPVPDSRPAGHRRKPSAAVGAQDPRLGDVVRMMLRYPSPVGERLVWPWAIGLDELPRLRIRPSSQDVTTLVAELRRSAALLVSQRWTGGGIPEAFERAWARLRKGDGSPIVRMLSRSSVPDPVLVAAHLENLGHLAEALTRAGKIPHPRWMWYLDADSLASPPVWRHGMSRRIGVGRWDPFIHDVIASLGRDFPGHPAAGGWGAGRLRVVRNADEATACGPREIIIAPRPVVNLAPLLWNAAGLVTEAGGPGAHLFEVAGWLGVPAVCGVDIKALIDDRTGPPRCREDFMAAVDGDTGRLTVLCRKQAVDGQDSITRPGSSA
jgi:phosphohistidine swiveling domain-containing protein